MRRPLWCLQVVLLVLTLSFLQLGRSSFSCFVHNKAGQLPKQRRAVPSVSRRLAAAQDASTGAEGDDEEKPKTIEEEFAGVTGTVRLYATHTLCISCLAACCQFKRLLPNVKLEVAFDVWRETRRWVGSGEDPNVGRDID
eukprot:TRINITY_DN6169_c0_g1_i1.p2 TRINITY_DN6169_c0_g1~~TRINITY_DN6169_c0_g1_i1.p2  ORF type:complete len:140 (+),score=24.93 TRINITY_DN6169_c0_g1_i1:69-488(+)